MIAVAIVREILEQAEKIEREKNGKALTPPEVQTIKAAAFLRKITGPAS